jgi:hypothetical protein
MQRRREVKGFTLFDVPYDFAISLGADIKYRREAILLLYRYKSDCDKSIPSCVCPHPEQDNFIEQSIQELP